VAAVPSKNLPLSTDLQFHTARAQTLKRRCGCLSIPACPKEREQIIKEAVLKILLFIKAPI
jgi:hypothetical protein